MSDKQLRGYIDLFTAYVGVFVIGVAMTPLVRERSPYWGLVCGVGATICIAIICAAELARASTKRGAQARFDR